MNEGMESLIPVILVGGVLAVILLAALSAAARHRRRKALAAWAQSIGLTYAAERNPDLAARLPDFAVFHQGQNRYAFNVVSGTFEGREVVAFDYHYETRDTVTVREKDAQGRMRTRTKTRITHHRFSAVLMRPELQLKPLLIRPEGVFDKVADFFGRGDLDFESAEFSRRYHVTAPDRRWAYDVLHARTIDFPAGSAASGRRDGSSPRAGDASRTADDGRRDLRRGGADGGRGAGSAAGVCAGGRGRVIRDP